MAEITANSSDGRVLLALRAGPMAASELYERLPKFSPTGLQRRGLIESAPEDTWRLTAAGRAACPLRNPLAATVAPAPAAATTARRAGLPPLYAGKPALPHANPAKPDVTPSTPPGEDMQNITFNPKKDALSASRAGVLAALKGIDREHALSRHELIALGPASVEDGALINALRRLVQEGKVGAFGATTARRFYSLEAQGETPRAGCDAAADHFADVSKMVGTATGPAVQPAEDASGAESIAVTAQAAPARIEFAIYDDGRLALFAGDERLILPPEATHRLGRFLARSVLPRIDPSLIPA